MVQFKDVSKIFGNGIAALKDINFTIDESEFVFLIGPSGSGKTTLIEMLIRDQVPTYGKIYLQDTDITKLNRKRVYMLRRQIGVIFQDYKLVPDKTAFENVSFAMEAAGRNNKDIKETVPYLLEIVGLQDRMDAFPAQLSGGEKQRVAIARAIANNPRILIADEPTGNLDPASAWDIVQILTKINNWGTTVIMSTHGTDIVNALNKRVIQMERGIIVRDDSKGGYELPGSSHSVHLTKPFINTSDTKKTLKVNITDKVKDKESTPTQKRSLFGRLFGKKLRQEEHKKNESNIPSSLLQKFTSSNEAENENIEIKENSEEKNDFENSLLEKIDTFGKDTKNSNKQDESAHKKGSKVKMRKKNRNNQKEDLKEEKPQATVSSHEDKQPNTESVIDAEDLANESIDSLGLDVVTKTILIAHGYETIESLITAGPEKLEQIPKLDAEDVLHIAQAIEKYLDSVEE